MARERKGQTTQRKDPKTGKKYWVARWIKENGKLGEKKCRTKTEAQRVAFAETLAVSEALAKITADEKNKKLDEYRDMTHGWAEPFPDIVDQYERAHRAGYNGSAPLKANTMRGYQKHHRFFCRLFEASGRNWISVAGKDTRDGLIAATTAKPPKFSRKTAKSKFDQLKRVCQFAVAEGLASYDPTAGLDIKLATAEEKVRAKAIKREAAYRPEEITAMLRAADALCEDASIDARSRRSWNNCYRPLLHLLVSTGIRIGEAQALTRSDIDTARNRIRVESAADYEGGIDTPKSANAVREITVRGKVIEQATFALSRHNFDYVFASANGTVRAYNALRDHMLVPLCERAEVKRRGFHGFRHHFASKHIAARADIVKLSQTLGHHTPAFTMEVYAHFFEELEEEEPLDLTAY